MKDLGFWMMSKAKARRLEDTFIIKPNRLIPMSKSFIEKSQWFLWMFGSKN